MSPANAALKERGIKMNQSNRKAYTPDQLLCGPERFDSFFGLTEPAERG